MAISIGGRKYAEAHHIIPLGNPHRGPDIKENLLVLCPNHHVMLDYGAIELQTEKLFLLKNHNLQTRFITYHNEKIYGKVFV